MVNNINFQAVTPKNIEQPRFLKLMNIAGDIGSQAREALKNALDENPGTTQRKALLETFFNDHLSNEGSWIPEDANGDWVEDQYYLYNLQKTPLSFWWG